MMAVPVLMPVPMDSSGSGDSGGSPCAARAALSAAIRLFSASRFRFNASMARCASIADRTASQACRGLGSGPPQKAITQSPMYLSSVPLCFLIAPAMVPR